MAKAPDRKLGRGAFSCLLLITFLTAIGNTGLISVMPAIGRSLHISDFLIASIFSLSALIWAISSPMWAPVADRRGRKPLIQMGMIGFIISMAGCSLAIFAGEKALLGPIWVFAAFFLCRASYGLFGSAAATATQAYIADRTAPEYRVQAFSGLAGALSLGTIFGPAIAPLLLIDALGLTGPLIGFAAFAALALVLSIPLLPSDRADGLIKSTVATTQQHRIRDLLRDPKIAPYLLFGMVLASAQAINIYSIGFVVIDRSHLPLADAQKLIGLTMGCGALTGLLGQWGLVRWLRMNHLQMVRWGATLALAGNILMIVELGHTTLTIGFALASLGYGFGRPGFSAGASIMGNQHQQSAIAAAISSIAGASIVLPPVLAVALYQQYPAAPFLICIGSLIGLTIYLRSNPIFRSDRAVVSTER